MNKYLVILLLSQFEWLPSSSLLQKNLKGNIFYKANVVIQNTVNTIFKLLQLNKKFTSEPKHRILLSMHASMKNIAERNYPTYRDVKRACKLYKKGALKAGLFNLDKLVNILVEEKLTPANIPKISDQMNKTGINLQLTSLEIPDNEGDSFAFLKEYLNNLDSSYGFDSPLQKIKEEFEKNKEKVKAKRRLKAWKGTNFTSKRANYRRVFQGKRVTISRFPFLASIHDMGRFVCAGSIISKLMIITAASCLQMAYYNKDVNSRAIGLTVRVGSDHTESQGELCNVSQVFFHPQYNPETLDNNLAIIKMKKLLKLSDKAKKIRRIEYQRVEGELLSSVNDILIVGWGDTNTEYSNGQEPLTYTHLSVFNTRQCIDIYTSKYVNEKNFCAGFSSSGAGACQRDIGGPGISGSTLVGVISFGPPICGAQYAPTVFTNIGYHIKWIESVLRELPQISPVTSVVPTNSLIQISTTSQPKFEYRSTNRLPDVKNKTKPVLRSSQPKKYPKAIQVLTYILNGLLSAGQTVDNMMFGDEDANYNIAKDNLRTDNHDVEIQNSEEEPNKDFSQFLKESITEENLQSTKGIQESYYSHENYLNGRMKEIDKRIVDSYQIPKPNDGSSSIYSMMKGIQGYLGLDKLFEFSEVYKPLSKESDIDARHHFDTPLYTPYYGELKQNKQQKISLPINQVVRKSVNDAKLNANSRNPSIIMSDNYETDVGMSIEVSSEFIPTLEFTSEKSDNNNDEQQSTLIGLEYQKDEVLESINSRSSNKKGVSGPPLRNKYNSKILQFVNSNLKQRSKSTTENKYLQEDQIQPSEESGLSVAIDDNFPFARSMDNKNTFSKPSVSGDNEVLIETDTNKNNSVDNLLLITATEPAIQGDITMNKKKNGAESNNNKKILDYINIT